MTFVGQIIIQNETFRSSQDSNILYKKQTVGQRNVVDAYYISVSGVIEMEVIDGEESALSSRQLC
jgi:hypothetical protein